MDLLSSVVAVDAKHEGRGSGVTCHSGGTARIPRYPVETIEYPKGVPQIPSYIQPVQATSLFVRLKHGVLVGMLIMVAAVLPLPAQDDVTTQNGASTMGGGWITGPASNPLSFLNGPAFRTSGSKEPYDFSDFSPAVELASKLPGWLLVGVEERFRSEGYSNGSFRAGNDDSYSLNRFRLSATVRAGSWFKMSTQVQDSRPFFENPPVGPPNENRWDLKLAYAEIGDPEKHWWSLRVGRQLMNYNNTVLANSEWRNQGRSYDAAVLNLQKGRIHLGIFAASAVVALASGLSHHEAGNNIYGLYGRIDDLVPHSILEPFVLWRVQPAVVVEPAVAKTTSKQNMWANGLRMKGQPNAGFDYSGEVVVEIGTDGSEPIRAWAVDGGVAYRFNTTRGHPRIFSQIDVASGNQKPGSGMHTTFDTLYPTAHDRFGILDQFGWQNIENERLGGTIEPHRRLTITAQASDFRAVSALDAVYNTSGVAIAANKTPNGSHIGEEADLYTWYELNKHFNIGAGYGWFGGGDFLSHIVTGHAYSSSYIVLNFKDNGKR